ncbi:hypothetical protein LJR219_003932 [Phenylobacterium sp. LjRoot219]|uniref:hypothetical protein n=1 Tax=Phenylobacterium sp. LjRoot219 TaxID=3342283 RepID=UPI003ECFCE06
MVHRLLKEHRRRHLRSDGTQRHIMDITGAGGYTFGTARDDEAMAPLPVFREADLTDA